MSERYFKVLNSDGSCFYGGTGKWPLPNGRKRGKWMPEIKGKLVFCERGYHILKAEHLIEWFGPAIFEVEVDGEILTDTNKCIVRRARLIKPIKLWNEKIQRIFACDCTQRVLPIFEKQYPDDKRPRQAIEVARRFAIGKASQQELAAARAAAWAAAWAAAGDAAGDAAWAAARAAAWDAAWAAAGAAAGDAAWAAARDAAWAAAWAAARDAAWAAARDAAWAAAMAAAMAAAKQWQSDHLLKLLRLK